MSIAFRRTIPILRIFDVAKAKEFYAGFLGFAVGWEHRFDEGSPAYMQVSRGDLTLHLSEHHGDCCPGSTVFVWMEGVEEYHREIIDKGYKYLQPAIETTFVRGQVRPGDRPLRQPHPVQRAAGAEDGDLRAPRNDERGVPYHDRLGLRPARLRRPSQPLG